MQNLTCNSTFGNFKWTASVDVSDEQARVLANAGLLQILQRSPASKAEKVLGKYEKRPSDFVRSSIPFSDENAKTLAKFLGDKVEIADGVTITPKVAVEYHEIGAASQPKFVDEKAIAKRHVDAGDFAQWMSETVGFKATVEDVDKVEVLQAIKAYKARRLAAI
jgi:hypothetical protein